MDHENRDETAWTRQIWYSQLVKVILSQSKIEAFQLLFRPNMWAQVISTMDQRWMNDGSRWINGRSTLDQRCIYDNIQCVTYDNCATSSTKWNVRIGMKLHCLVKFDTSKKLSCQVFKGSLLTIFSAEYVGTSYINYGSTMDQPWIVGTSFASTCSSWWPDAKTCTTTFQKARQRKQTETEKWKLFVTIEWRLLLLLLVKEIM